MKKRLMAFFLVVVIAMSLVVPATATEAVEVKQAYVTTEQYAVVPFTEMIQPFFRTYNGRLQVRIWSLTWGRWITDWEYV